MAEEKIRCKVTDTKQDILKAYTNHLKELNERSQGSLDPQKVTAEKAKVETLKRVESVANLDVTSTIAQLQNNVSQTLAGILSTIERERATLADVTEAVRIKNEELKELYGIEKQASALAALIEAHKTLQLELQEEHAANRKELDEEIAQLQLSIETQRKAWQEEFANIKKADTTARQREIEEYNYKTTRDRQARLDAFNDDLAKKTLVITEREKAVEIREKNIGALEQQIKDLTARLTTDVEAAVAKARDEEKRSAQTAKQFSDMAHKSELEKVNTALDAEKRTVESLTAQIKRLEDSLESANKKMQSIAEGALRAQADVKTIAEMRTMETSSKR